MIAARQIAFGRSSRKKEEPPAYWGLCFTAEEDGATIGMQAVNSAPAVTLETSYDGDAWEPFYVGETSIALKKGERVYFRAGEGGNARTASSLSNYNNFSIADGRVSASGNIESLLNGDSPDSVMSTNNCYTGLFQGCTSLTHAPELPATTLKSSCYSRMFLGCTSLTHAPELPATILTSRCYANMFQGCTSLTHAPELPATTLITGCYSYMFASCSNLNFIECSMADFGSKTSLWVSGVYPTGTFICPTALGTNETIKRGTSYCPEGWTVINKD